MLIASFFKYRLFFSEISLNFILSANLAELIFVFMRNIQCILTVIH